MARIKLRIVLNKGRQGAPLAKLGRISEQAEKFLLALAADCNVQTRSGEWLAVNFKNGSVEYDAEFQGDVDAGIAQVFAKKIEFLADFDPENDGLNGVVSERAAIEYARIGGIIDPDENIGIGIYFPRARKPKWRNITYSKLTSISRQLESPMPAYGAIQGILHSWLMGVQNPNFQLRELSSQSLVRVFYSALLYSDVAQAVQERTTVLVVSGNIQYDRVSKLPIELKAARIERMPALSSAQFEKFFGSAPQYSHDFSEEAA
jgi:hypothetical protein